MDLLALARRKFLEGVVRTRNVPEVGLIRGTKVADCAGRRGEGETEGKRVRMLVATDQTQLGAFYSVEKRKSNVFSSETKIQGKDLYYKQKTYNRTY